MVHRQPCFCRHTSWEDFWEPCSDPTPRALRAAKEPALNHGFSPESPPPLSAPSASSLLGPTKEAHIPQLFSRLQSWLKFTPWEIQCGGWLLLECVWLGPSVPTQRAGSAGARGIRNPQPPTMPENGMCCSGGLKQARPRRWGSGGSWGSSCHKAASVPLEAEPTSLELVVGRPVLLAQWLRISWSQWGQGRTEGRRQPGLLQ